MDDNDDILSIVEEVLAYENFEVRSLRQSKGLLTTAATFRPDLMLLDYKLADGNGGELCLMLKAHQEFKHIPIVLFSAYTHPGIDLMKFGCDAVIAKPFDLTVLTETIRSLLDGSSRLVTD